MEHCTLVALLALALLAVCANCKWVRLDPCDNRSHPDGSDIVWPVEVDDSNGTVRYRYPLGPPPFGIDLTNSSGNSTNGVGGADRERRAATTYRYGLWTGGIVPYDISSAFSDSQKEVILDGLRHWENKTCLRFRLRGPRDYSFIYIDSGSCCCSLVGRAFGGQSLLLNKYYCVSFATVVHEIGHAVGFWHEHNRPDRDQHVTLYPNNIEPGQDYNFQKLTTSHANSLGTPYDAVSIMHYRETSFSVNGRRTLESKHGIPLGGPELSPVDVKQARLLYNCPADPSNDPPKMVPAKPDIVIKMPTQVNPKCSHYIKASSGVFSSPNYPSHYTDNITCGWILQAPSGYDLHLRFAEISLDSSPSCRDTVAVYNSVVNRYPRKSVCRSSGASEVAIGGRVAIVMFTTDTVNGTGRGFTGNFSSQDRDECRSSYYLCQYTCINTQGSYRCDCPSGMYSPETNKYQCLDANECMNSNGGCSHQCINTYRSYKCTCPSGMTLHTDGKTCFSNADPCRTARCQHSCTRSGTTYSCSCNQGFNLNLDQHACNDINECQGNHNCHHLCVNTVGSYRCECNPGYSLNGDKRTCADINECTVSSACTHNCHNTLGSYTCSCRSGYELVGGTGCRDLDECAQSNGGCAHTCRNTPGSFTCGCQPGYMLQSDSRTCADIDECNDPRENLCNHFCLNTEGAFHCACREGYELMGKFDCENINECASNNGGCDDVCTDTPGSYACSCTRQLALNQDNHTCISPNADCTPGTHGCQSICNGDLCTCQSDVGYQLSRSGQHCVDIDECLEENGMCSHFCNNTLGSYFCSCPMDLSLDLDLHNCVERSCDLRNGECSQNCFYSVRGVLLCSCNTGLVLDEDGRQCKAISDVLSGAVGSECSLPCEHVCNTSSADHTCQCFQGYRLLMDGVSCEEIDECTEDSSGCSHGCLNTDGSYICTCPVGYKLMPNQHICMDVDECSIAMDHGCAWRCNNTVGSYHCLCPIGFAVSVNGKSCVDIDECSLDIAGCSHFCANTNGSFLCTCPVGRISLSADQRSCIDYDECADPSLNHCNETCLNNFGSFACSCNEEKILAWDGFHCQEVCSGEITAPASIQIPSPENGTGIMPFVDCEWSIMAEEGKVIAMDPSYLELLNISGYSPSEDSCESYLMIYNGPSNSSVMLKKHCLGSPVTGKVVSSTSEMHVTWHSGRQMGLSMLSSRLLLPVTVQSRVPGTWTCDSITIMWAPGVDFGPANFPAVIDSPVSCRWFAIGPLGTAIEILFADVPNSDSCDAEAKTGNCLAVVQASRRDTIHSSSKIQRIAILDKVAIVLLTVYQPLGFRGFHARYITVQ